MERRPFTLLTPIGKTSFSFTSIIMEIRAAVSALLTKQAGAALSLSSSRRLPLHDSLENSGHSSLKEVEEIRNPSLVVVLHLNPHKIQRARHCIESMDKTRLVPRQASRYSCHLRAVLFKLANIGFDRYPIRRILVELESEIVGSGLHLVVKL